VEQLLPQDEITKRFLEKLVVCQRLTLLGKLSSDLTHEINNQLTGVSGYAQLLLGQERALLIARELEKISSSADECKKLIFNYKRLARFTNQEKEYCSLNIIIRQALDLFRRQFAKKNLEITEDYSDDLPVIETNAGALEHAFANIIQNALEALQESGSRLSIRTAIEDQQLLAVFEDDGPGISQEAHQRLFAPFFSTKSHLHCMGLGLAATKAVVEECGGKIRVDSLSESGTSVRILLPLE